MCTTRKTLRRMAQQAEDQSQAGRKTLSTCGWGPKPRREAKYRYQKSLRGFVFFSWPRTRVRQHSMVKRR